MRILACALLATTACGLPAFRDRAAFGTALQQPDAPVLTTQSTTPAPIGCPSGFTLDNNAIIIGQNNATEFSQYRSSVSPIPVGAAMYWPITESKFEYDDLARQAQAAGAKVLAV